MAAKRQRKTTAKPRLILHLYGIIWFLTKHPALKSYFVPLTEDQQAPYRSGYRSVDETAWPDWPDWRRKADEFDLNKAQSKKLHRTVKKTSKKHIKQACRTFCTAPRMFLDPKPGWILFLICLLSRVMDMAVQYLPSVPVIHLKDAGRMVPESLAVLLKAAHGPEELRSNKFRVKRPCCVQAFTPLGAAAPSALPEAYFGGYVKIRGKRKYFWLPLRNSVVAIAANVPQAAWSKVLEQSCAVPIFCSTAPKWPNCTVLTVDGAAFHTVDPAMLKNVKKRRKSIYLILTIFDCWLRAKKKRWKKCLESAEQFYPRTRNARFVATTAPDDVKVIALALAVFQQFLFFASEKTQWITHEEANDILSEVWQQVLPESFPKTAAGTTGTLGSSWDTSDVFWGFLGHYLRENQQHVSLEGTPCRRDVIAVTHRLSEETYLIMPRELVAHAYADYLKQHGVETPTDEKSWPVSLQRTILDWGIQVKTEKKDITWRLAFYEKESPPTKCKVPCLAFPLGQLPESITNSLSEWFGDAFGHWLSPKTARNEVEPKNVMDSGGNEQETKKSKGDSDTNRESG